jgi:hypothetical protein
MIAKSKKLQKILGKTDIQNGPDRNPFLIEYSYLAKLKRSLDKMRQQNVDDKIDLDDELREAERTNSKGIYSI